MISKWVTGKLVPMRVEQSYDGCCRDGPVELTLGQKPCLHGGMSGDGLRQEVEIPLGDDASLARFVAEVYHLMVVCHLACCCHSRDSNRHLARALHKANRISSVCNDDICSADPLDQIYVRHEWRMRARRNKLRRSGLREDTMFGAKRYDRSD